MKWFTSILMVLSLASCATMFSSTPRWGSSDNEFPITTVAQSATAPSIQVSEVPSKNEVHLKFSGYRQTFSFSDQGNGLTDFETALSKYVEWNSQLAGKNAKISKPIKSDVYVELLPRSTIGGAANQDIFTFDFSLETGSDGNYYLKSSLGRMQSLGNNSYADSQPTNIEFLFNETQVSALKAALSQDNILAKAREADEAAKNAAAEDAKNQELQNSLQ